MSPIIVKTGCSPVGGVSACRKNLQSKSWIVIEHDITDTSANQTAVGNLFKLEKDLPPINVMFLYQIIEWIGDVARPVQRVGKSPGTLWPAMASSNRFKMHPNSVLSHEPDYRYGNDPADTGLPFFGFFMALGLSAR